MQAWEHFLDDLKIQLGSEVIQKWLRPLKIVHFDACNLYLEAETNFQVEWFEEHIRPLAKKKFLNNNFHSIKVHISCQDQSALKTTKEPKNVEPIAPTFTLIKDQISPLYTIDNFIFNKENTILLELIKKAALAKEPLFNPIFLSGGPCCGKTHLLQAFTKELEKQNKHVLYVKAETFTENVINAIRSGNMQEFRKAHRHIDALVIDDIQHLAKKLATQEEFFHTFNALQSEGKQIVLSANVPPSLLENIEPRLISRFEWGLSLPIAKLEKSDLLLMIKHRSKELGLSLSEPCLIFLLDSFHLSLKSLHRSLEALCLRVTTKTHITPEVIKKLLKDLLQEEAKGVLTPSKIATHVANFYGIPPKDIVGKSQTKECVLPRQIAMFLCRKELKMPFAIIGEYFDRDHSTVMSSIKIIEEKTKNKDSAILTTLVALQQKIEEPLY